MPKNVETQCWIAKTVWQRIPGRWSTGPQQQNTDDHNCSDEVQGQGQGQGQGHATAACCKAKAKDLIFKANCEIKCCGLVISKLKWFLMMSACCRGFHFLAYEPLQSGLLSSVENLHTKSHISRNKAWVSSSRPRPRANLLAVIPMLLFYVDCTAGDFRCGNGQCIPSCKRCDGILDCYDHSDEHGCSKTRS